MNKKQKIIFIAAVVLLGLFLLWFIFDGVPVEAYKVTPQDATKGVTVSGTVKSVEDILVATDITGNIEKFYIKEGDYVEKNQLIATLVRKQQEGNLISSKGRLDTAYWELEDLLTEPRKQEVEIARIQVDKIFQQFSVLNYTIKRAKIDLADAKIDEDRYMLLKEAGAVSKRELEQKTLRKKQLETSIGETQEQIQVVEDELKQARENLSLTIQKVKMQQIKAAEGRLKSAEGNIIFAEGDVESYIVTAPVAGIITDKLLHTGDIASPSAPVVRLVVPKLIYLSMDVEEKELAFLKKGQKALVVFDAYPDKVFECYVTKIEKQVNPSTGTFEVRLSKPKDNIKINVGMTLDATIITNKFKNILIIPTDFVTQRDNKTYVFKKDWFWAKKTYIKTDNFDNNRTKIIKGLKKDDIILKSVESSKLKHNKHIKITGYYKT